MSDSIKRMRQLMGIESDKPTLPEAMSAPDWKKIKDAIGGALNKAGLDGNKSFKSIGQAINAIQDVLGKNGVELDDVPSADLFKGSQGRRTFHLAMSNPDDAMSPSPIAQSMIVIQWYKHDSGNFEVTSYIS